ncbi:ATP-binding protein [Stenotrophomonas sp.]|uniref:sensor histidine kinase n=1 Tax=Stenotrophomonas sp. TaxID=69392 RepID=UPI0028A5EDFA|nr:ATP-binding protein [Stenotrophomonas sp.]
MNAEEAKGLLRSHEVSRRLLAARYFQSNGEHSDLTELHRALSAERVHWIRQALLRSIHRIQGTETYPSELTQIDESQEDLAKDAYSKAIESVAGVLLHEVSSVVGAIGMHCAREIEGYQNSKTRESIERLKSLLAAIRRLKKAVAVPAPTEFELSSLVITIAREEAGNSFGDTIKLGGPRPFSVITDCDALSIAIANGMRNAIEASTTNSEKPEVTINWGRAGGETFLAIIDSGPGLPENSSLIAQLGQTSKPGHFGFGLATAQQAMDSIMGSMILTNDQSKGAIFELRWRNLEDIAN